MMKALHNQLRMISKALLVLSKNVDKFAREMERLQTAGNAAGGSGLQAGGNSASLMALPRHATLLDMVYDTIRRSRKGASIQELREKTGLSPRQLSNALYKLSKKDKIEARQRGVYFIKNKS